MDLNLPSNPHPGSCGHCFPLLPIASHPLIPTLGTVLGLSQNHKKKQNKQAYFHPAVDHLPQEQQSQYSKYIRAAHRFKCTRSSNWNSMTVASSIIYSRKTCSMSSFASRRFCGILHPRCTERLRTLSNVQSDAFTGLIYASRRDQISGMRTVHVHAIGIESPGRCHIVIAKPGYS